MYRLCVTLVMGTLFSIAAKITIAQIGKSPTTTIVPYEIAITYNKTTNLIFPYAVRSVDRGSGAVIVQTAKGVANILQVKAAKKDFDQTNLSIVTADGRFYSFLLEYAEHPSHLNVNFAGNDPVKFNDQLSNAAQLERESCIALSMPRFMRMQGVEHHLHLQVSGIYNSENNLWLNLRLYNAASVDFQPSYLRFFLRDRKRLKRTALRETEILPIHAPAYKVTAGHSYSIWTIGFKPFTVPKHKRLIIQIGDETRGRVMNLPIKSKFFLRAHKLPS